MIKNENSLLQQEEQEKETNKPLSDEEISSLIKASNESKFNEVELKVKKKENVSFKKVALHEIAKQINQIKEEKVYEENKSNALKNDQTIKEENETVNIKKDVNNDEEIIVNEKDIENSDEDIISSLNKEETKKPQNINISQEEHFKILEKEKNLSYEKGKTDALNEIKEGADAATAQLKKIIESISKVEEMDLKEFEKNIENKIIELAYGLTGKSIKELPEEFVKKIKELLLELENIEGNINILINEDDFKVIQSNKNIKNEIKKLSISPAKELQHGEIQLKINGITIRKTIV